MKNNKIPIIQPLRTQGGTFYTFASAVEDIGLNITNRTDTIKLSHYALLDIPTCNELSNDTANKFNIFSMPGAIEFRTDEKFISNFKINPNVNIAQSFLSYALNLENTLINSEKYDYTTGLSVSERVFWKWLKETGAIRWHKDENGNIVEGDNSNDNNYKSVVKAIGRIDAVNNRSGQYGIYNEIFVNIPSSFGDMSVFFTQQADNNYKYNMQIKTDEKIDDTSINTNNYFLHDSSLYNITFSDYSSDVSGYIKTDGVSGGWCEIKNVSNLNNASHYYVTDAELQDNDVENNMVEISNGDNISYSFLRSKYDCMKLDVLLENEVYGGKTYDEEAKNGENYNFNAILLYYSILDSKGYVKATNLYGVYFIDSPVLISNETDTPGDFDNIINTLNFYIPSLNKIKSTEKGFGTAYSFKINMRTSSIYDNTKAPIIDNSSSENSIVNDFNDVLSNLNTSIELLNKHVKHSSIISEKYTDMNERVNDIQYKLNELNTTVSGLLNKDIGYIKCNTLDTKNLIVDNDFIIKYNTVEDGDIVNDELIDAFLSSMDVVNNNNQLSIKTNENQDNNLKSLICVLLHRLKKHDNIIKQICYNE